MRIEYLGHACFSIISSNPKYTIVTDPYKFGFRDTFKYDPVNASANVVTVSHQHADHNFVSAVSGEPVVVTGVGSTSAGGIDFTGIATYHDTAQGKERGSNTIFVFIVDNIKCAHLGDLGHSLDDKTLKQLYGVEVLFAPIGGHPTMELQGVIDLWEKLKIKVVFPMHYRTEKCPFPKYGLDDLIKLRPNAIKKLGQSQVLMTQPLPKPTEIWILNPAR